MIAILLGILISLSACQQAPTQVREQVQPPPVSGGSPAAVLALRPVILDVRSPLDFGVSHVPGAISVNWEDFLLPGSKPWGLLEPDDFRAARRLALWGIAPDTPVLVIGAGEKGRGEEGWLAWYLRTLGVARIFLGTPDEYRGQIPRPSSPPENKPVWHPEVRKELRMSAAEGRRFLAGAPWVSAQRRVVVDARSQATGASAGLRWRGTVVPLSWPVALKLLRGSRSEARDEMARWGLQESDDILVISDRGLEGGAVTFVLDELGFSKAHNLIAGLRAQ